MDKQLESIHYRDTVLGTNLALGLLLDLHEVQLVAVLHHTIALGIDPFLFNQVRQGSCNNFGCYTEEDTQTVY